MGEDDTVRRWLQRRRWLGPLNGTIQEVSRWCLEHVPTRQASARRWCGRACELREVANYDSVPPFVPPFLSDGRSSEPPEGGFRMGLDAGL